MITDTLTSIDNFFEAKPTIAMSFHANREMQLLIKQIKDMVEDTTGCKLSNSHLLHLILTMAKDLPISEYLKYSEQIKGIVKS